MDYRRYRGVDVLRIDNGGLTGKVKVTSRLRIHVPRAQADVDLP